jgi:NAD(P)-dependent dehydrogenase (short-subunit alcohol dehydrogenase family)
VSDRAAVEVLGLLPESRPSSCKEVDVALYGIGAQPVPRGASVADAARWRLDQLSGALLADGRRRVAGTGSNPPLTGVFAPVDLGAIRADPACTAEYFAGLLQAWGIGWEVTAGVEQGTPDAVRRLDITTGVCTACTAGAGPDRQRVVDLGSARGGTYSKVAYLAAKAAIIGFTRASPAR